jgi:hypothetical protein
MMLKVKVVGPTTKEKVQDGLWTMGMGLLGMLLTRGMERCLDNAHRAPKILRMCSTKKEV